MSDNINDIELSFDDVIIGDSFRMFRSKGIIQNDELNLNENQIQDQKAFYYIDNKKYGEDINYLSNFFKLEENENLSYSYFMKNIDPKVKIPFNNIFLSKLKEDYKEKTLNKVFFDNSLINLSSDFNCGCAQVNDKFYFFNSNKFLSGPSGELISRKI